MSSHLHVLNSSVGVPRHPLYPQLSPLLDKFASTLPQELVTFALIPPYAIPPREPRYPAALARHILTRIPPPATPVSHHKRTPSWPPAEAATIVPRKPHSKGDSKQAVATESGFMHLSMPPMPPMPPMPNMNFGLELKNVKWGWPAFPTFGKGGSTKAPIDPSASSSHSNLESIVAEDPGATTPSAPQPDVPTKLPTPARKDTLDVDRASLLEAISTESIGSYTRAASPAPSSLSKSTQLGEEDPRPGETSPLEASPVEPQGQPSNAHLTVPANPPLPPSEEAPLLTRSFITSTVHLNPPDDPLRTEKKRVHHLTVCG